MNEIRCLKALASFASTQFKKFSNQDETCVWVHVLVLKNPENNHYLEWKAVSTTQIAIISFRVLGTGKQEEHFPQFKTWKPLGAPLSLHSVLYSTILYMLCMTQCTVLLFSWTLLSAHADFCSVQPGSWNWFTFLIFKNSLCLYFTLKLSDWYF